jgi:hypothetical protein
MSLLDGYSKPTNQNRYLQKIENGTVIRFLEAPVFGWKDIAFVKNAEGKSEKVTESYWKYEPTAPKPQILERLDVLDLNGKPRRPKHFWGCLIYNYNDKAIQYWELDKSGIMDDIIAIDKDWDLLNTDLKLSKEGEKMDTKYKVTNLPPSTSRAFPENIKELLSALNPDLNRIFTNGGDPFEDSVSVEDLDWSKTNRADEFPNTDNYADPTTSESTVSELPDIDLNEIQTPF